MDDIEIKAFLEVSWCEWDIYAKTARMHFHACELLKRNDLSYHFHAKRFHYICSFGLDYNPGYMGLITRRLAGQVLTEQVVDEYLQEAYLNAARRYRTICRDVSQYTLDIRLRAANALECLIADGILMYSHIVRDGERRIIESVAGFYEALKSSSMRMTVG